MTLSWSQCLYAVLKIPRILKKYANSTLSVLYKWNNKAWMTAYLFTTCFSVYFNPSVETYSSRKKDFFWNITVYWHLMIQELWWRCTTRLISFTCLLTTFILYPMGQGVILTFKFYYLINIYIKAIAAIDKWFFLINLSQVNWIHSGRDSSF